MTLFVQPHLDDVALSLGGTVALDRSPLIVTVFCAPPAPETPLTPLAQELHRRWGAPPETVWETRRIEDDVAAEILRARTHRLGHLDAMYRGYATIAALRGPPSESDRPLAQQIADELVALWRAAPSRVYLPLAIGGHVDHRLCHAAGAALRAAGAEVLYYEDFPYVTVAGALDERLAELGPLEPATVDITTMLGARKAAIAAYASQLPVLFRADGPFPGPHDALVARYVQSVAGERCWRPR